jgi:glucose/arabinose dehydrogenase
MDRLPLLAVLALLALLALPGDARADDPQLPDGFSTVTVASGLFDPTAFAYAPDGRVLIAEKRGLVRVIHPRGSQAATTILDISDHVATGGDRGLLGIAVDPEYATNHYVYLLYTFDDHLGDSEAQKTARLTRVVINPDDTVTGGEHVLLGSTGTAPCPTPSNTVDCIPSTSNSHTIGTVRAAPDGTLWVGSGDGSDYNAMDPGALRTLDEQSLSGKILHVDREGRGLPGHPFCPGDNVLTHVCTKLYAKGFRNPFRFSLRPGAGPVVGDVGWESWEELDFLQPGGNYGWPCWEGGFHTPDYEELDACKQLYTAGNQSGPVHFYAHNGGGGAIVAGPQYTGTRYPPEWRNAWFFGDYVTGFLKAYDVVGGQFSNPRPFAPDGFHGVDLELTPEGDLAYLVFTEGSGASGSLQRIVYGNAAPPAVAHAMPSSGHAPLEVQFSADESIDPDGDAVTYDWDFGDGSPHADGRTVTHTYAGAGAYTARLTVRDARDLASEDTVDVDVDVTPPVATIEAPADGQLFRHGTAVALRGTATDAEDGELSGDALQWHIVLHHGSHVHTLSDLAGGEQSFVPAGDHDANSYYEINFTATDSTGRSDTRTVRINPETIKLTLASSPPGVTVTYSGVAHVTPEVLTSAIGYHTSVAAPAEIVRDEATWRFTGWSDGGARQHNIVIPTVATTLTATYARDEPETSPAPPAGSQGGGAAAHPPVVAPPRRVVATLHRARRGARTLAGGVTGWATSPRVRVALRTRRGSGRCRHWSTAKGRFGRRIARCAPLLWARAAVTPAGGAESWRWRVKLHGRLPRGRYVVTVRVADRRGRALLAGTPAALRVR